MMLKLYQTLTLLNKLKMLTSGYYLLSQATRIVTAYNLNYTANLLSQKKSPRMRNVIDKVQLADI